MCALPEFRRQRPRPGGVPCRERDVVAGGVPEPAYRRADAAGSENCDLHSLLPPSEAISCRDDELATGPVLLHVGVRLHDLVEPVHAADRDGGRAGGDGVEEVLQTRGGRSAASPLYAVSRTP